MGTGLFIIDAIIIAIVILPFVLFIKGSKKRARELRKPLQAEAAQNSCTLTKFEVHGNFAIGVDATSQKLFFHKKTSETSYLKVVDLNAITVCKAIKETKQVKDKHRLYDVIENIQLQFSGQNEKDDIKLEFYNNDDEMTLNNELVVAQKWQDEVNKMLTLKNAASVIPKQSQVNLVMS